MKLTVMLASLALACLAGCSSLPHHSGFKVRTVEATGRQEPWQNNAINLAPFSPQGVALVYVALPQPIPNFWRQEFSDSARVYEMNEGGRKVSRILTREVFRAVAVGDGQAKTYDAVYDQSRGAFLVFAPLAEAEALPGRSLYILSSDGKWAMTVLGKQVMFDRGFAPDRLTPEFLATHRSVITQVIRLETANEHALGILDELVQSFPVPFAVRGRAEQYRGKADVATILAQFTAVEHVADKLLSCTSFKLGSGTAALWPLVATLYGIQAGTALAKDDCLKPLPSGPVREEVAP